MDASNRIFGTYIPQIDTLIGYTYYKSSCSSANQAIEFLVMVLDTHTAHHSYHFHSGSVYYRPYRYNSWWQKPLSVTPTPSSSMCKTTAYCNRKLNRGYSNSLVSKAASFGHQMSETVPTSHYCYSGPAMIDFSGPQMHTD